MADNVGGFNEQSDHTLKMGNYRHLSMPIRDVMADIDKYVIPENKAAIEYLWAMNILTTQTNNYNNETSFINIGKLSPENEDLLWNLYNTEFINADKLPKIGIVYGGRGIEIAVKPGSGDTLEAFKPLIDRFAYQDVQEDGYMSIDEFFIKYTDCWIEVNNPEFKPLRQPRRSDFATSEAYSAAYEAYVDSTLVKRRIVVFDESKVTKSLEEYLRETGFEGCFDPETDRIYYNRRLYEGHLRYKDYVNSLKN